MNCLYTVNCGSFLTNYSRASFESACVRWHCDYAEFRHACFGGYPGTEKWFGCRKLSGYDALLYLDADMVIAKHAPNPFELCDQDELCVVTDCQAGNPCAPWREHVYNAILPFIDSHPEFQRQSEEQSFNAGLMLFRTTRCVRAFFDLVIRYGHLLKPKSYQEQALTNLCAYNTPGLKVSLLPTCWNYMVIGNDAPKENYINHFGGTAQQLLRSYDT